MNETLNQAGINHKTDGVFWSFVEAQNKQTKDDCETLIKAYILFYSRWTSFDLILDGIGYN